MSITYLEELGLTSNEISIYLCLIKNGELTANEISEKTSLHRGYVYDTLSRLSHKGIVSLLKKSGVNHYKGVHPRKLNEIMDEKSEKIKQLVPDLVLLYQKDKSVCDIEFFEGKEGIKTIHLKLFRHFLQDKKRELLQLGLRTAIDEHPLKYFQYNLKKKAEKEGIIRDIKKGVLKYRLLLDPSLKNIKRNVKQWANYKYLPKTLNTKNINFVVVDNYVMIESLDSKPFAILITNQSISIFYKNLFETLWSISRK